MQYLGYFLFSLLGAAVFFVWWHVLLKLQSRQPLLEYRERPAVGWSPIAFYLAAIWIVMLLVYRFGRPTKAETPSIDLRDVQTQIFSSVTILLLLLAILAMTKGQTLANFSIRFSRIREQITDGVIGFLASMAPVMLVLLATSMLRKKETQHAFLKFLESDPGWTTILWIGLTAVVVTPVAEELLFRVILQGRSEEHTSELQSH